MFLPTDEECVRILNELRDAPALTQWESDFIESNLGRTEFSDMQKEVIASFRDKYDV